MYNKISFRLINLSPSKSPNCLTPKSSIENVFKSVQKLESDYGMVPIENSVEGSINNTLDLLSDSEVVITGEMELTINQCLLSRDTK